MITPNESDEVSLVRGRRAASFEEDVRPAELGAIHEGRRLRYDGDGKGSDAGFERLAREGEDFRLSALAFSGGGMRSAIFNLGVIQGFARLGLLRRFDYLSINSGSSYIGSWLTAWIRRDGIREVEGQLRNDTVQSRTSAEAKPVAYLRRFSNDLTPRMSFFSINTWTMAVNYLWNLLLNQTVLVLAMGAIIVAPRNLLTRQRTRSVMLHNGFSRAGSIS